MSEISQITAEGFDPIVKKLIDNYKSKGMKASGEFEQSLEVIEIPNGAVLMGAGHVLQLEFGRGPTSSGSSIGDKTLLESIREWINDKGIVANDISQESLAHAITHKIHNEGWDRVNFGGVNLVSDSITDDDFQAIIDKVMAREINNITEKLISILK